MVGRVPTPFNVEVQCSANFSIEVTDGNNHIIYYCAKTFTKSLMYFLLIMVTVKIIHRNCLLKVVKLSLSSQNESLLSLHTVVYVECFSLEYNPTTFARVQRCIPVISFYYKVMLLPCMSSYEAVSLGNVIISMSSPYVYYSYACELKHKSTVESVHAIV